MDATQPKNQSTQPQLALESLETNQQVNGNPKEGLGLVLPNSNEPGFAMIPAKTQSQLAQNLSQTQKSNPDTGKRFENIVLDFLEEYS